MNRKNSLIIAVILLTSCAVTPEKPGVKDSGSPEISSETTPQANAEPSIVFQDELLNEPPENPRFFMVQPPSADASQHFISEQAIADSIKQHLQKLGYSEAASRDDANVVVWYSYDSEQTGMRAFGETSDAWGEQIAPVAVADMSSVLPVSFKVQIISLEESRFPHEVIPIWRGEWSSSLPRLSMVEFSNEALAQVFELYQSEHTQSQIAAFRLARERRVKAAMNTYMKMVMYRIQKNWQKPKTNVKGKTCEVKIFQSAVGEIKSHELLACDRDRRFRRSIEKAIKASSPLPLPQEHLFDRSELILIFQG